MMMDVKMAALTDGLPTIEWGTKSIDLESINENYPYFLSYYFMIGSIQFRVVLYWFVSA